MRMCRRELVKGLVYGIAVVVAAGPVSASPLDTTSGVVIAVVGDTITIDSPSGPLTVTTSNSTRIWKGEDGVAVQAIRPGDELSMQGSRGANGNFAALKNLG